MSKEIKHGKNTVRLKGEQKYGELKEINNREREQKQRERESKIRER